VGRFSLSGGIAVNDVFIGALGLARNECGQFFAGLSDAKDRLKIDKA